MIFTRRFGALAARRDLYTPEQTVRERDIDLQVHDTEQDDRIEESAA